MKDQSATPLLKLNLKRKKGLLLVSGGIFTLFLLLIIQMGLPLQPRGKSHYVIEAPNGSFKSKVVDQYGLPVVQVIQDGEKLVHYVALDIGEELPVECHVFEEKKNLFYSTAHFHNEFSKLTGQSQISPVKVKELKTFILAGNAASYVQFLFEDEGLPLHTKYMGISLPHNYLYCFHGESEGEAAFKKTVSEFVQNLTFRKNANSADFGLLGSINSKQHFVDTIDPGKNSVREMSIVHLPNGHKNVYILEGQLILQDHKTLLAKSFVQNFFIDELQHLREGHYMGAGGFFKLEFKRVGPQKYRIQGQVGQEQVDHHFESGPVYTEYSLRNQILSHALFASSGQPVHAKKERAMLVYNPLLNYIAPLRGQVSFIRQKEKEFSYYQKQSFAPENMDFSLRTPFKLKKNQLRNPEASVKAQYLLGHVVYKNRERSQKPSFIHFLPIIIEKGHESLVLPY